MTTQTRTERMQARLTAAFDPLVLEIVDESAQHAGHTGASADGQTHYSITMTALAFRGQSRVARSRAVYDALTPEFGLGLHAISLRLNAPTDTV